MLQEEGVLYCRPRSQALLGEDCCACFNLADPVPSISADELFGQPF
jgi:hypothetical protein